MIKLQCQDETTAKAMKKFLQRRGFLIFDGVYVNDFEAREPAGFVQAQESADVTD